MTGPSGGTGGTGGPHPAPAVYFLSDYGTVDEFVGVVHAVLHRLAPAAPVIDLSHQIPAFDVAAGSAMLVRSAPHLGPGVVLAVVDPGVGTDRRAVALELDSVGPRWLLGPDNGLLLPMADALGGVRAAVALEGGPGGTHRKQGTFDGRDVFAPAAGHLVTGGDPDRLGEPIDPDGLHSLPGGGVPSRWAVSEPNGSVLEAAVTWVDRFGNVQLGTVPEALSAVGVALGGWALVTAPSGSGTRGVGQGREGTGGPVTSARRVRAFGHLSPGELGLLEDANGQVSLVLDRASAARALGLSGTGSIIHLEAEPTGGRAGPPASGV
jgi:S-adenosyl-L-methionine hydrolase (adenosine-forming)